MKVAQVWGDMSSEKSSENYPTIVICDECIESRDTVTEEEWSSSWGEACEECGKTIDEEREEAQ